MSESTTTNESRLAAVLKQLPREDSPHVRLAIVKALAKPNFHSDAALNALGSAVQNDLNDKVRSAAATALLTYEGRPAVGYVDHALAIEQGEDVRLTFCLALASSPVHREDPAVTEVHDLAAREPECVAPVGELVQSLS